MSCKTSKENLRDRRAAAIEKGWDWVPELIYYDAECPYCGVDLAFDYDYEGASFVEEECPACGKAFDVSIDWDPVYNLSKKEGIE